MNDETKSISSLPEADQQQASEIRYRRLFESAPDGILILETATQKITNANLSAANLLGCSPPDLLGKELWEIGLFKDKEECETALRELQSMGHRNYENASLETKEGVLHAVEFTCTIYSEGTSQVVQCHLRDITDRLRSEAELLEQSKLLTHAQRIGRMGNWSLDLNSGLLVWSAATCSLFGITPAEFRGTLEHFYSFILDDDLPAYKAAQDLISFAEPWLETEYRIRRPEGTVRWVCERSQVDFNASGSAISRVGIVMDITKRHTTREALAQNAALLAQIAGKAARLGGWAIQLPERTLTWSDENCAIHDLPAGYKPTLEEGIGYFPPEYQAQVAGFVDACAKDGIPYDFELPKFTATGRLIWVRSIGEAVRDEAGKIIRIQGAFQDITVRKKIEDERERLIKELQEALGEVRTLREFLPICSYCKKVRDDQNYWSQIDSYLSEHAGTKFSHGICPECYENRVGPGLAEMKRRNAEIRENDSSSEQRNKS